MIFIQIFHHHFRNEFLQVFNDPIPNTIDFFIPSNSMCEQRRR
eukprot:UN14227